MWVTNPSNTHTTRKFKQNTVWHLIQGGGVGRREDIIYFKEYQVPGYNYQDGTKSFPDNNLTANREPI